jgi:hypothetical protein
MGMNTLEQWAADEELLQQRAVAGLASGFLQQQLPRALGIQVQLTDGEFVDGDDAAFLAEMLDTLASAGEVLGQQPEVGALHRCARSLYDDIMTEASARTSSQPPQRD